MLETMAVPVKPVLAGVESPVWIGQVLTLILPPAVAPASTSIDSLDVKPEMSASVNHKPMRGIDHGVRQQQAEAVVGVGLVLCLSPMARAAAEKAR